MKYSVIENQARNPSQRLPWSNVESILDKRYKGILAVKFFFNIEWGGGGEGGNNHRNRTKYQKSHITFARDCSLI